MITVKVIDENGVTSFELDAAPTILSAFEDAGFQYPHGCRVGVCGSCLSEVTEGAAHLAMPDFIESRRLAEFREEANRSGSSALDATHLRFCCRTPLTGPVTLRPLSGSVRWKI